MPPFIAGVETAPRQACFAMPNARAGNVCILPRSAVRVSTRKSLVNVRLLVRLHYIVPSLCVRFRVEKNRVMHGTEALGAAMRARALPNDLTAEHQLPEHPIQ